MTPRLSPLSSAAAASLQPAQPCPLGMPANRPPQWLHRQQEIAEIEDATRSRIRTTRIAIVGAKRAP